MSSNWTEQQKLDVWNKGEIVPPNDPKVWRKDECGAWIKWMEYANRSSTYGWEIDHITPEANGGKDILSNLRPVQWKNNLDKSDGRLKCNIVAGGVHNVNKR